MKKLSTLLQKRAALLRQARLANLAFAYETFRTFAQRVERAGLRGEVTLQQPDADAERYWATLTTEEMSQSVIEEHFADEDLMDLANMIGFVTGNAEDDVSFRIDRIEESFLAPIRVELEKEGVAVNGSPTRLEQPRES